MNLVCRSSNLHYYRQPLEHSEAVVDYALTMPGQPAIPSFVSLQGSLTMPHSTAHNSPSEQATSQYSACIVVTWRKHRPLPSSRVNSLLFATGATRGHCTVCIAPRSLHVTSSLRLHAETQQTRQQPGHYSFGFTTSYIKAKDRSCWHNNCIEATLVVCTYYGAVHPPLQHSPAHKYALRFRTEYHNKRRNEAI